MRSTARAGNSGPVELDQMAEYFDRTDAGDLPWEEATEVVIERPELEQISLRLPKQDLDKLKRHAIRAGVGYTTLMRMILRQYLRNPMTQ